MQNTYGDEQMINLIDCIQEITGRQIAMRNTTFVYLDTKENVESSVLEQAETLKTQKEEIENYNDWKTQNEIDLKNLTVEYKNTIFQAGALSTDAMAKELLNLRAKNPDEGGVITTIWKDIDNDDIKLNIEELMQLHQMCWDKFKKTRFPEDRPKKPVNLV